jgi:hypothetical protein
MTVRDLEAAVQFLRRLTVGRIEEERLIRTVEALEQEIRRRRQRSDGQS